LVASLAFTAAILWHFHDQTWWPPDDGVYGYVAQRILAGDVLNGNLHDLHAGYVNFLHAAALWLFGEDLVSLRYPLALLTVLQSALVFLLLRARGPIYAAVGAAAAGLLSFVLFVNPSANWYAQVIAFGAVAILARAEPRGDRREIWLGVLLATAFLFRQLSGVFVAIGVLTWLLVAPHRASTTGRPLLARLLALVMALGLVGYLWGKGSVDGAVMFGLGPLILTLVALTRTQLGNRATLAMIARLAMGGALATLPLLTYHLVHGSLHGWINDAFLSALHLTTLDFIDRSRFWHLAVLLVGNVIHAPTAPVIFNALFWLGLLAAPVVLGASVAITALRRRALHPLPVVACVCALNSVHYEIWIYLVFSSALCLVALMWMFGGSRAGRRSLGIAVICLAAVSLIYQAGQPATRSVVDVLAGRKVALDAPEGLPGVSLAMTRADQQKYRRLLALIEEHVEPDKPMLALPFQPELYFLSRRRSIFDFYITTLSIRDEADLAAAQRRLTESSPPIIIYRPGDKYSNWASEALMTEIKRRYRRAEQVGSFDVYLPAMGIAPAP
jgi:hypothetical protein